MEPSLEHSPSTTTSTLLHYSVHSSAHSSAHSSVHQPPQHAEQANTAQAATLQTKLPTLGLSFVIAYGAVCLIWGSTYLAVRFALETLPIFTMGGTRFIIAGVVLMLWMRWKGATMPTQQEWRSSAIVGAFLILGGNLGSMMSVKFMPTGVAALIATSLPMWMVLIDWLRPQGLRSQGLRPHTGVLTGLLLGCMGIVLLMQPWNHAVLHDGRYNYVLGTLCSLGATLAWAFGSMYSRHTAMPSSPLMATGAQMLVGGVSMLLLGGVLGEWSRLDFALVSTKSLVAVVYLIIFGAIIAFSAYSWLLHNVAPALASSYTYINPLVAVLLGWAIGGERVSAIMLFAAAVILAAVLMIARYRQTPPSQESSSGSHNASSTHLRGSEQTTRTAACTETA